MTKVSKRCWLRSCPISKSCTLFLRRIQQAQSFVSTWLKIQSGEQRVDCQHSSQTNSRTRKASKTITTDLATYFTSPGVFNFGSSWNRFLVDSSIKDLVVEKLGYTSFDGMTNEAKKALYCNYPENDLLKFDEILASHISSLQCPISCQVKAKLNSCCFRIDSRCKLHVLPGLFRERDL